MRSEDEHIPSRSLESIPPQVLLTFRDTLSAALRCSVTFADHRGIPVAVERFGIHRRFTSRVCQKYHCARNSPIKTSICDAWDRETSHAINQSHTIKLKQCGLGYWCASVPVLVGGELIGQIQAGERWLEDVDPQPYIEDGLRRLQLQDEFERELYRKDFLKSTSRPNVISQTQANAIVEDLTLFAQFLSLLVTQAPATEHTAHTAEHVLQASQTFQPIVRSAIQALEPNQVRRLFEMIAGVTPFADNWLREFHDPGVLEPTNSLRRQVLAFVVFADLRNFTDACNIAGLPKVHRAREELFGKALEIIKSHGGIVDRFIGDAMLAFFLSPTALGMADFTDDESKELALARSVGHACIQLGSLSAYAGDCQLRFGIGLSRGEMLYGHYMYQSGHSVRREITGIGAVVNKAARLSSLARKWASIRTTVYGNMSPILLDNDVSNILSMSQEFYCQPVDDVRLKGFGTSHYERVFSLSHQTNGSKAQGKTLAQQRKSSDASSYTVPHRDIVWNLSQGDLSMPASFVIDAMSDYYEHLKHSRGQLPLGDPQHTLPPEVAAIMGCSAALVGFRDSTTGCLESFVRVRQEHQSGHTGASLRGDALVTDQEHPSVVRTLRLLGYDVKPWALPSDASSAKEVETMFSNAVAQLDQAPCLVVIPHVTWKTGLMLPFRKLAVMCRDIASERAWQMPIIVVDGAHALGHVPVQIELAENEAPPFDAYITCAHKWLRGPHGVGIFVVSQEIVACARCRELLAWGDCFTCVGGLGHEVRSEQFRTHDRAKAYATLAAIRKFRSIVRSTDSDPNRATQMRLANTVAIRDRIRIALESVEGVTLMKPIPHKESTTAILSISVKGTSADDCTELRERLSAVGVLADVIREWPFGIRFSIGNDLREDDVEEVSASLIGILSEFLSRR